MLLELFINFDGNCRDAVNFYAKVFRSEVSNLMTYGEAPPEPGYEKPEADINRVCYAGVKIGESVAMFCDISSADEYSKGGNVCPTVSMPDKAEVVRVFNELKEGGEVYFELSPTFFSELYGTVEDKFGVVWNILHYVPK